MTQGTRRWPAVGLALASIGVLTAFAALVVHAVASYETPAGANPPSVTDWMQGWSGVAAVFAGLLAAGITAALLIHEMREARRARRQAAQERAEAEIDREAARRDRELLAEERRDAELSPARNVVIDQPKSASPDRPATSPTST